jgi:hypothetical protein
MGRCTSHDRLDAVAKQNTMARIRQWPNGELMSVDPAPDTSGQIGLDVANDSYVWVAGLAGGVAVR